MIKNIEQRLQEESCNMTNFMELLAKGRSECKENLIGCEKYRRAATYYVADKITYFKASFVHIDYKLAILL